jgi:hypothetical protein
MSVGQPCREKGKFGKKPPVNLLGMNHASPLPPQRRVIATEKTVTRG